MIIFYVYDSRSKMCGECVHFPLHRYRLRHNTKKSTCVRPLMLPVVCSVTAACNSFGWVPLFRTDCTSQIAWSKCLHFQNATCDSECKNLEWVYTLKFWGIIICEHVLLFCGIFSIFPVFLGVRYNKRWISKSCNVRWQNRSPKL